MAKVAYEGDVPVMRALRSFVRWRAPDENVSRWKHRWGFHTTGVIWDAPLTKVCGRGKGLDTPDGDEST